MAYRRRSVRRIASKSKRNFLISLILIIGLGYVSIIWLLPQLINLVGSVRGSLNLSSQRSVQLSDTAAFPPPVLNIPYEATISSRIDIHGYSTPNSKVKLFLDEAEAGLAEVLADGSFIFENIPLNLGTNNLYGKTVDEEGKMSLPSKTFRIIYDNEKPLLEVSEPQDNKTVAGERKIKIAGKTEVGARIFINGSQIIVDKEGNFSEEVNLNDGDNIFNIKASDAASNFTEISRRVNFTP